MTRRFCPIFVDTPPGVDRLRDFLLKQLAKRK